MGEKNNVKWLERQIKGTLHLKCQFSMTKDADGGIAVQIKKVLKRVVTLK